MLTRERKPQFMKKILFIAVLAGFVLALGSGCSAAGPSICAMMLEAKSLPPPATGK